MVRVPRGGFRLGHGWSNCEVAMDPKEHISDSKLVAFACRKLWNRARQILCSFTRSQTYRCNPVEIEQGTPTC